MSVSENGEHSLRSVLNWVQGSASDGWYWRADATRNTLIGILNADTEEARVQVSLDYYSGGQKRSYELPELLLPARSAELVDVAAAILTGQPDPDGDVLPAEVSVGGYKVRKVGPRLARPLITEALVFDPQRKNFETFYNTCCFQWSVGFTPTSLSGSAGGSGQITIEANDSCSGERLNFTGSGSFFSQNSSVAAVPGTPAGGVNYVSAGSTNVDSSLEYNKYESFVDPCVIIIAGALVATTVNAPQLGSFRVTVMSTPVQGETNSVVSGQSAQVKVEALSTSGAVFTGYRGTVQFSSTDTVASLPGNYTYTATDAGVHNFNVTLRTVAGTSATRGLTVRDAATSISTTKNISVWFHVAMDVEFWKNCGFVSCPNFGSYFCQTAYKPAGWPQPQSFIALTQSSTSLANRTITVRNGTLRQVSFVGDAGPVLNQPYWNTGSPPPSTAGCLSDVLAGNLGIANGCNGSVPFGGGTVFWRFGN